MFNLGTRRLKAPPTENDRTMTKNHVEVVISIVEYCNKNASISMDNAGRILSTRSTIVK